MHSHFSVNIVEKLKEVQWKTTKIEGHRACKVREEGEEEIEGRSNSSLQLLEE